MGEMQDAFEAELAAVIHRHGQKLTSNQILAGLERALSEAEADAGDDCCPGCGACPGFTGAECDGDCEWAIADAKRAV